MDDNLGVPCADQELIGKCLFFLTNGIAHYGNNKICNLSLFKVSEVPKYFYY